MMILPEEKKYPTVVELNEGLWTTPENALNIEDNLCAVKLTLSFGNYAFRVGTFPFTVPSDAIIDGVFWDGKVHFYPNIFADNFMTVYLILGVNAIDQFDSSTGLLTDPCSASHYHGERDVTGLRAWQPSDLQYLHVVFNVLNNHYGYYIRGITDAVYIRVVYHLPIAAAIPKRRLFGVGRLMNMEYWFYYKIASKTLREAPSTPA